MEEAATTAERRPTMTAVRMNANRALRAEDRWTLASMTVMVPLAFRPKERRGLDLDTTRPPK
nr:hypothetical protein [Micromonospora purpureochromogenes]